MSREITRHRTNALNEAIAITADDRDPKNGNASHAYRISYTANGAIVPTTQRIGFQHGPIAEHGVNGITNEALLAVVIDRLEGFQSGPFACDENARALNHALAALGELQKRTARRVESGVEGTNEEEIVLGADGLVSGCWLLTRVERTGKARVVLAGAYLLVDDEIEGIDLLPIGMVLVPGLPISVSNARLFGRPLSPVEVLNWWAMHGPELDSISDTYAPPLSRLVEVEKP